METFNPYGDSVSLLYGIWSEITGPFCTYNFETGDYKIEVYNNGFKIGEGVRSFKKGGLFG